MRAYLITTAAVFALILVAHIFRLAAEGMGELSNVPFAASSLVAAGLFVWACVLVRRWPSRP